jgi:hypothetical protein
MTSSIVVQLMLARIPLNWPLRTSEFNSARVVLVITGISPDFSMPNVARHETAILVSTMTITPLRPVDISEPPRVPATDKAKSAQSTGLPFLATLVTSKKSTSLTQSLHPASLAT